MAGSPSTPLGFAQDRLRDEAISVFGKDCFASLLRNKIPQPVPPSWIPACAGMTKRLVSASTLSAPRYGRLAMTPRPYAMR
jgi:hypothetical protein